MRTAIISLVRLSSFDFYSCRVVLTKPVSLSLFLIYFPNRSLLISCGRRDGSAFAVFSFYWFVFIKRRELGSHLCIGVSNSVLEGKGGGGSFYLLCFIPNLIKSEPILEK